MKSPWNVSVTGLTIGMIFCTAFLMFVVHQRPTEAQQPPEATVAIYPPIVYRPLPGEQEPFELGVISFTARVLYRTTQQSIPRSPGLLVEVNCPGDSELLEGWGGARIHVPQRRQIFDTQGQPAWGEEVAAYDLDGNPISFEHIPAGAMVMVSAYGHLLTSSPGILPSPIEVRIVDALIMMHNSPFPGSLRLLEPAYPDPLDLQQASLAVLDFSARVLHLNDNERHISPLLVVEVIEGLLDGWEGAWVSVPQYRASARGRPARGEPVAAYDLDGNPTAFEQIPAGAIVDVSIYGQLHRYFYPAIAPSPISVRVTAPPPPPNPNVHTFHGQVLAVYGNPASRHYPSLLVRVTQGLPGFEGQAIFARLEPDLPIIGELGNPFRLRDFPHWVRGEVALTFSGDVTLAGRPAAQGVSDVRILQ